MLVVSAQLGVVEVQADRRGHGRDATHERPAAALGSLPVSLRRPVELLAHALGKRADDEVVGVLDQVAHELVGQLPSSMMVFQWRLFRW